MDEAAAVLQATPMVENSAKWSKLGASARFKSGKVLCDSCFRCFWNPPHRHSKNLKTRMLMFRCPFESLTWGRSATIVPSVVGAQRNLALRLEYQTEASPSSHLLIA